MKKEDLDALAGLYEGVYSPANNGEYLVEELNLQEAPMTAFQAAGGNAKLAQLNRGRSPRSGRVTAAQLERQGQENLFKAGGGNAAIAKGPTRTQNVRGGSTRQVPTLTRQDIINRGTVAATKPASTAPKPPTPKPGDTTPAANRPATPAAKPAASAPGAAKVAPSSTKPATPAKPAGSAMDQWAAANPKLAAAKAERDRTRGTSATTNPLMKDFKDRLPAPKAPSPSTSSTAFAKTSPSLSSSSSAVKSAGTAAAAKPTTNQTSTAFSSPSLVKPAAPAPAAKPAATMQKRPAGPGTGAMTRGGASGDVGPNTRTIRSSYEWGSKTTLKDVESLYSSIYEGKKKDQDKDGDNDFADVRIARMIASGMSKAEAIAAVKNKPYNEEVEILDEAEGSYGATPKAYSAASKTKMTAKRKPFLKKMLSRTNPANRTSPYDSPRKGMTADDRESARAGSKHGVGTRQDHDYPSEGPGGITKSAKKLRKQKAMGEIGEAYEIVASYLLENNFAATLNDANVIIENMSEVWLSQILESAE